MKTKEAIVTPEESPKRSRSRLQAAENDAAEPVRRPRRRAAAEGEVEETSEEKSESRRRRPRKAEEAGEQLALAPPPEARTEDSPPVAREPERAPAPPPPEPPRPPVIEARAAPVEAPPPPPVAANENRAPEPERASNEASPRAPSSEGPVASLAADGVAPTSGDQQARGGQPQQGAFQPNQGQPNQGQPYQGHRHDRGDRHRRHGHGQPYGQQQGQPGGQGAPGAVPQVGQQNPGAQMGGPNPGQQQPGMPGQHHGHGRRRRRRGRGGGGGGGGQPGGQPGQMAPHLEAQLQPVQGILEIDDRGFGRLRRVDRNYQASENDPDVPKQIIDRYRLRPAALVNASALLRNGRPQVQRVDQVEGVSPDEASNRLSFMNLTSLDPDRRIILETTSGELLTRAIDVIAPIGFGQRGLIVAPPKTGKTIILQKMAKGVLTNHPKAKLMVLLVDERPEEVTDFKRSIGADVYASSSDRPAHEHLRLAEMVMERARRIVEGGGDVVILLDSITRLARAFNKEIESSGRTMSGGVDSRALERPKRLFGAARNTEEAGSLTIIATALIDTGSRMDEVIFEEFKGTGNMEIVLDRQLAERRLWPAINVNNSGTRKEEKLFSVKENEKIRKLRSYLAALRPVEAMEKLLGRLRDFRSNAEFFDAI